MRKLLIIALFAPLLSFAKGYEYSVLVVKAESLISARPSLEVVNLFYEDQEDELVLMFVQGNFIATVMLDEESRRQLRPHIDKYLEWRDQAQERQVELTKDIGEFTVARHAWKGFGDTSFSDPFQATVVFQSESPDDHYMVLTFPEVQANNFRSSSNRMNSLYFEFGNAMMLDRLMDEDAIDEFLAEQKAIEDSFQ